MSARERERDHIISYHTIRIWNGMLCYLAWRQEFSHHWVFCQTMAQGVMCSSISWRHLHHWVKPSPQVWHCKRSSDPILKIASTTVKTEDNPLDREWTFNFKTAFVDCVVWFVQDTRICSVAKGERSYHVFFQLLQACKHSSRETDRKYTYLLYFIIILYIEYTCMYIYMCIICDIHIVCKSIQIMCIYIFTYHTYSISTQN